MISPDVLRDVARNGALESVASPSEMSPVCIYECKNSKKPCVLVSCWHRLCVGHVSVDEWCVDPLFARSTDEFPWLKLRCQHCSNVALIHVPYGMVRCT